jgi:hypothetical protein
MKKIKKAKIELKPSVLIAAVSNGWVIQILDGDEGEFEYHSEAISYDPQLMDDDLSEKKAICDLLWRVLEGISVFHSKHNKYNVVPSVVEYETQKIVE